MYSIIAVTNKHTAKLHHVGSLYTLTYDARKLKHKMNHKYFTVRVQVCVVGQGVPYVLKASCSYAMLGTIYPMTLQNIPEDLNPQEDRSVNLKCHVFTVHSSL